jgi:hypothetical protein
MTIVDVAERAHLSRTRLAHSVRRSFRHIPEDSHMPSRTLIFLTLLAAAAACSPRQVDVRTAPVTQAQVSVQVSNTLAQAVNVYVRSGGADTFLKQVGAKSTETIPVQGFASGTSVTLKAVTLDGLHTYSRDNVTLTGTYTFPLP